MLLSNRSIATEINKKETKKEWEKMNILTFEARISLRKQQNNHMHMRGFNVHSFKCTLAFHWFKNIGDIT